MCSSITCVYIRVYIYTRPIRGRSLAGGISCLETGMSRDLVSSQGRIPPPPLPTPRGDMLYTPNGLS